ncbi:hypothetical protein R6Q59_016969 [Mikania micrantha]
MAKFLSYVVYEIDLSKVEHDSDMQTPLLQTTPKSQIVVENLDRFITSNSTPVSLTVIDILNFMDDILNSCCSVTMRNTENTDPSIVRLSIIDVHIRFPLCNFNSFKTLTNEILQTRSTMILAEMTELMIFSSGLTGQALESVITALHINDMRDVVREERFLSEVGREERRSLKRIGNVDRRQLPFIHSVQDELRCY